ncbi:hypothetical protein, partial [Geomicrobium sp. JCM 19037]|uniref:hypothetical protein n=1 Tax=Geomicrobium sp. JCM 19037 TaxID=1460634 RepID=UPI001EE674DD
AVLGAILPSLTILALIQLNSCAVSNWSADSMPISEHPFNLNTAEAKSDSVRSADVHMTFNLFPSLLILFPSL